ncbi:hypothetical protein [Pseudoalteromonas piscicida]|uniref:hypothetical protein n=1 Tax=Pseudoalteromonas piscicida TaxID=43662 RepID=UPI000E358A3A|nr:hypothetical protein [Pseudoalteromonas piscicida]AXQ99130.1 hypothetical protein D0N37_16300 [Pseudoalteromonas piscicida]
MTTKVTLARRVLNWISENGKKPKAIAVLSGLSIGDFFVPALPTQTSVMLLAWLQPKKILTIALMFAIAAAVGSSILILLATILESFLQSAIPSQDSANFEKWQTFKHYINEYGLYALALMSLLPTPPRTMVVLSLLAGISGYLIVATVLFGKLLWFTAVVLIVSRAPNWLPKIPWIGKKIAKTITFQQQQLKQNVTQPISNK